VKIAVEEHILLLMEPLHLHTVSLAMLEHFQFLMGRNLSASVQIAQQVNILF